MKHLSFGSLCGVLVALLAGASPAFGDLDAEVKAVAQDKLLQKGSLGVMVMKLGATPAEAAEVYNRDAAVGLIPASNLKLVTTSAALNLLGPEFKFRTLLVKRGDDVILVGDGDPTFGDAKYLRKLGWSVTTVYQNWAEQLRKLNVASVHDVLVDDSVFDEQFTHPNWPDDQWNEAYMAQVGGVNLNANLVDFGVRAGASGERVAYSSEPPTHYLAIKNTATAGNRDTLGLAREPGTNQVTMRGLVSAGKTNRASATVHDPPMYAATVLAETLAAKGVKVTGAVRRDRTVRQQRIQDAQNPETAAKWSVVGVHETPLAAALARANKDSVNMYAESLCKRLGHAATRGSGTWESGAAAVAGYLKHLKVPDAEYKLDDGCGLSKQNRISPNTLIRVLTFEYYGKNRETFMSSLSVAGVDGTLDDRFRGSDLRQRVMGKSGYVDGVSTLSGYLRARSGQWYAFSIMMNGLPRGTNADAKMLQERIVKAIDGM